VIGKKPGRQSDRDITVFDSTGLAIQDVAVAGCIYQRAVQLKRGLALQDKARRANCNRLKG
jgi:alanine dehydrogenase